MSRRTATDDKVTSTPATPKPREEHRQLPSSRTRALHGHAAELAHLETTTHSWKQSWIKMAKNSTFLAFVRYVLKACAGWVRTLVLSPVDIFFDPTSVIASLIIYPVIFVFLGIAELFLRIFGLLGGQHLLTYLGDKVADGYSIINWTDPGLFKRSSTRGTLDSARATLCGKRGPTTVPSVPSPGEANVDFSAEPTKRIFDLSVAKTFLVFSALVYERIDSLVKKAAQVASTDRDRAEQLLLDSERVIRDQAHEWGLEFEGISDLSSTSGPFASVFYTPIGTPENERFIVCCFKGTTPSNYAEFLVDATISRTTASPFFGSGAGAAHAGFYTDLFGGYGYAQIVRSLKHLAGEIRGESDVKIPLWITGHSLGSALASLLFSRFMHMPDDLGPDMVLRDAYTYGTPRLGDADFVSAFEAACLTPIDRPSILWRVVNSFDIVCQIPPGLADSDDNRGALSTSSVLNYAHLGPSVSLKPRDSPNYYTVQDDAFHSETTVKVVSDSPNTAEASRGFWSDRWNTWKNGNVLAKILMLLPPPILDHFPSSYHAHMEQLRTEPFPTGSHR